MKDIYSIFENIRGLERTEPHDAAEPVGYEDHPDGPERPLLRRTLGFKIYGDAPINQWVAYDDYYWGTLSQFLSDRWACLSTWHRAQVVILVAFLTVMFLPVIAWTVGHALMLLGFLVKVAGYLLLIILMAIGLAIFILMA